MTRFLLPWLILLSALAGPAAFAAIHHDDSQPRTMPASHIAAAADAQPR